MPLITLQQARDHLNIDSTDPNDDSELQQFIDAAVEAMEESTGLTIEPATRVEWVHVPESGVVVTRHRPVIAVLGITGLDSGTAYDVVPVKIDTEPGVLRLGGSGAFGMVELTYEAGMAVPQQRYVVAGLIIVSHLWQTQRVPLSGRRVFGGGADNGTLESGVGWAIPRAASDLLPPAAPLMP